MAVSDWRYRADPNARGGAAGWAKGRFGGIPTQVPDTANPTGTGAGTSASFRGSVGWYSTTVNSTGGTYNLRFDSAASRADIYVDGHRLGSHSGAFDPFEFDKTLSKGRHHLVVRVDWRSPTRQSAQGFHRTWFNYGGLNGEVTIRRLHESDVTSASLQTTLVDPDGAGHAADAQVGMDVRVVNRGPSRRLHVEGRLRRGGQSLRFVSHSAVIGRGKAKILHADAIVASPDLWSPGNGARYELDLAVPGESGFRARVGLRTLRSAGGKLFVNEVPTVLKGASLHEDSAVHGDALTGADMDAEIRHFSAIGANATRAQHPLAPALLERLDAAGILVWEQIGPVDSPGRWIAKTAALRAVATKRVDNAVRAARLHPSIAVWSLGVEVAGNNGQPTQGAWIDARAREIKKADPGRLVGVDIWGPHGPTVPGRLYSHLDAIGFTSYFGWYEDTRAPATRVAIDLRGRIERYAAAFPGKLLVLTEFGAEGTAKSQNASAARGGRGYQAALIATQLAALRGLPLAGALVWILDDFAINPAFRGGSITKADPNIELTPGVNQKGLFDRAGHAKPAVAAVRAGLASLTP